MQITTPPFIANSTFGDILKKGVGDVTGPLSDIGKVANQMKDPVGSTVSTGASFLGLSFSRAVAFIVGIVCLIAGLMLFKPTQDVIVNTTKKVKDAAEVAAVTA